MGRLLTLIVLKSARYRLGKPSSQLNKELEETFDEEQIFRIDHYLGKKWSSIFANSFQNLARIFWNRDFYLISKLLCWTLEVEERWVATMITQGPLEMNLQTIPFSFCLALMDKPAAFTRCDSGRRLSFEQLHNPADDELKKFFIRGHTIQVRSKEKKNISYRSEPNVDLRSTRRLMPLVRSLLIAIASAECLSFFRTGKRLTQKDHGQCGLQANRLHLWT